MLMEVKNQIKVMLLSVKYNIMKQMTNKVTFITNITFMILNNASFIIQWIIFFELKDEIGGYTLKQIILLWGMAATVFGIANVFFYKAFELSELIINGKLDSFLVQPKNILLSVISSETRISAIGDTLYGYICLFIYGITIKNFILFTIFSITASVMEISAYIVVLPLSRVSCVIGDTWSPTRTGISPITPGTLAVMVQKPRFTLARFTDARA